ncbi:MAG: hypothetical protein ABFD66_09790 [Smithella sp.]
MSRKGKIIMIDKKRNTVINLMVILAVCLVFVNLSLADSDSLFIDKDGKVIVGRNLDVTEKVTAKSFEGNGSELALEGNKSITEIDSRMNTMNNAKLDKAGGVITGNVSIGEKDSKAKLDVNGDVNIQGKVSYYGRYQRDDQDEATYEIFPRYHLSLTAPVYGGRTKKIPQDIIESLCGDPDGCEIRLAMTRWSDDTLSESASRSSLFYYSKNKDGQLRWRASLNDSSGIDNNGRTEHVMEIWSTCYFTDGTYSQYKDLGDKEAGLQLLIWNNFKHQNRTCELTIID